MKPHPKVRPVRFLAGFFALTGAAGGAIQAQPGDFDGQPERGGPGRGPHREGGPGGPGRGRPGFDGPGRGTRFSSKMQLGRLWHGLGDLEERKMPLSKTQAARVVALVLPWSKKPQMTDAEAQTLAAQLDDVLTPAQKAAIEPPRPPRDGPGGPGFGPPPGGRGPRGRPGDGSGGPPDRGRGEGPPGRGEGAGPPDRGRGEEPPDRGRGEGPPPAFGRGRGEDFAPGQRDAMRAFFDGLNPFYPPTGYADWKNLPSPVQQDVARRYREGRATLESLSRQSRQNTR